MNKLTTNLMELINDTIIGNGTLDKEIYLSIVIESEMDHNHKIYLLKLLEQSLSLTSLNKKIYNYNDILQQAVKHKKSLKKYRNTEANDVLTEDYKKFENYVYSIIGTLKYRSKVSKTGKKVNLLDIHNVYGHDSTECHNDLFQEGRMYLWEGLKKYGVLPEKSKKFEGRDGTKPKIAGKSTFVFGNLTKLLINLGKKSSSDKFKHLPVEFSQETMGERDEDTPLPQIKKRINLQPDKVLATIIHKVPNELRSEIMEIKDD